MNTGRSPFCTLYLVRHGQAAGDGVKRYIGQTDLSLSEKGAHQARCLRRYFKDIPLSRIISSDLKRAAGTARMIAEHHSVSIEQMPDLREIHLGEWEGKAFEEIKKQQPGAYRARGENLAGFRTPGGESFADLQNRAVPAVERLISETRGNLPIAAHAGVNRVVLCHFLGMPLKNFFRIWQDNGGVNIVRAKGEKRQVVQVNLPVGLGCCYARK